MMVRVRLSRGKFDLLRRNLNFALPDDPVIERPVILKFQEQQEWVIPSTASSRGWAKS